MPKTEKTSQIVADLLLNQQDKVEKVEEVDELKREEAIRKLFADNNFTLPEDFVLTTFDKFVLSGFIQNPSDIIIIGALNPDPKNEPKVIIRKAELPENTGTATYRSTVEAIQILSANYGFPDFEVSETDIEAYFKVLRGHRAGESKSSLNKPLSKNFPDIRDRFNAMLIYTLSQQCNINLYPNFKLTLQREVAKRVIEEETLLSISKDIETSLNVGMIINTMILDLCEILNEEETHIIKDTILSSLSLQNSTRNLKLEHYKALIESGALLTARHESFSKCVFADIAQLWLEVFKRDFLGQNVSLPFNHKSSRFFSPKLNYIDLALNAYIRGGSAKANIDFLTNDGYRKLGGNNIQFGSFIAHMVFGIPQREFSIIDAVDNIYDSKTLVPSF